MTLLRAALATSLDGYIATKDGGVDWLNPFFSKEIDFAGFMKGIGLTVMGRRTLDEALQRSPRGGGAGGGVVLTHRPLPAAAIKAGAEAFAGDLRELAARLRQRLAKANKDVWLMGGGEFLAAFHQADLVDRWEISVMPITLGDGIPLFPRHSGGVRRLRLAGTKTLSNGIVELRYERAQ
ncbi:MAG TPA: dihydrofolate reductase family protein [Planctomycetota bacterium]|nr:dihydrofolate reductase family protein [Planctomycetota bacterium]